MFVTAHAHNRLLDRMTAQRSAMMLRMLEAWPGEQGTVAYIVGRLPGKAESPDGSNGDTIVAVAVEGSVETIYFRRSTQDMTAGFFGASRVVDMPTAYTLRVLS